MRKKRAVSNIIFGFATQLIIIVLGMIVPRLVLVSYGSDTNGFTSTITQIFTYMALLEAGIAQSTLNSLYEPVAKQDQKQISRIMSASQRYYRKVTLVYGLLVVVASFVIPFVINTQIKRTTAIIYILATGISNVIGFYYLESWKQLLSADGRYYISQIIGMIATILTYIIKIILIPYAISIAWIQVALVGVALIQCFIYKWYLHKHYSWVDFKAEPDNSALSDRYNFMKSQIASTIFTSTDILLLAIIGSTLLSSVYAIYNLVFHNLVRLLDAIYFGTIYILGQSWKAREDAYTIKHDTYDMVTNWAITATMSVGYLMVLSFVGLYTNGVSDINYIYKWLPLLFCLTQILSYNRYVNGNLLNMAGYASLVGKISIIEAAINLFGSIILGLNFGIYGVLLATVIALPVKVITCLYVANKKILKRSVWYSLRILLTNYILFAGTILYGSFRPIQASTITDFLCKSILCCIVIFPLYLSVNILVNHRTVAKCYRWMRRRADK